jgi:hypothetical protein
MATITSLINLNFSKWKQKMEAINEIYRKSLDFANKSLNFLEKFSLLIVIFIYLLNCGTEVFEVYMYEEIETKFVAIIKQTLLRHVRVVESNPDWMNWII